MVSVAPAPTSPSHSRSMSKKTSKLRAINVFEADVKVAEKPRCDQDLRDRFKMLAMVAVETFKVVMATLLAVTVPQFCDDVGRTCTISENLQDLTTYNTFVVAFNLITLAFLLLQNLVIVRREGYLIEYFDLDALKPPHNLPSQLPRYHNIKTGLTRQNRRIYYVSLLSFIFLVINTVVSAVLVFYFYYDGERTVSVFISNVLLVSQKAVRNWRDASVAYKRLLAMSLVRLSNLNYNVIDADYISGFDTIEHAEEDGGGVIGHHVIQMKLRDASSSAASASVFPSHSAIMIDAEESSSILKTLAEKKAAAYKMT